ncbi:MAG TPA: protein translocase subunit SecF [Jatrophihabitantaceae bacterium]|jgi:preprotein translocase subunit SecF|nr:protein translocase subunit SecF [Jatrophihabitantaceae bacterium]
MHRVVPFFRRLYRGETNIQFIKYSRRWYIASGVLVALCIIGMVVRGFNLGIDFEGGSQFTVGISGTSITSNDVVNAIESTGIPVPDAAQTVGSASTRQVVVRTEDLNTVQINRALAALNDLHPKSISQASVSSSWGSEVTKKAVQGLVVFLILVSIYIAIRFQPRMAVGAFVSLLHDLIVTAGVYAWVGFEVTPSTVIGLLTILGFSLYDTVVVFDKVAENTKDLTAGSRMTYSEAANLAVNQTLMRSINTSLISLLPVAGLLFVGAGLLGVGTIKDLALILFVGLAAGAYSSLFLATPIVCTLTERQPAYQALARRVAAKRASEKARKAELAAHPELAAASVGDRRGAPAPAPKPGARPASPAGSRGSRPAGRSERKTGPTRKRGR